MLLALAFIEGLGFDPFFRGFLSVLVGVVVLLWGNQVSMERLWWSLATVVVGLAAIQILIGAGQDTREAGPLPQGDIDVEAT